MTRGRYYQQVSDHVGNARDYLARRTDELADRRIDLANRAARLRARQPIADYDIFPAVQAAADGLAHAITAHRRTAAQQGAPPSRTTALPISSANTTPATGPSATVRRPPSNAPPLRGAALRPTAPNEREPRPVRWCQCPDSPAPSVGATAPEEPGQQA